MFCKKCGAQLNDDHAFCAACGAQKGEGTGFCANCGQPIAAGFGCVRRLRSTGSCNGSIYDSTHGSIRADARSSTLGGTAGER